MQRVFYFKNNNKFKLIIVDTSTSLEATSLKTIESLHDVVWSFEELQNTVLKLLLLIVAERV